VADDLDIADCRDGLFLGARRSTARDRRTAVLARVHNPETLANLPEHERQMWQKSNAAPRCGRPFPVAFHLLSTP